MIKYAKLSKSGSLQKMYLDVDNVPRILEMRDVHRVLAEKPEGKEPLGRPRHRWKGPIIVDIMNRRTWTDLIWLRKGTDGGLL